ncbi:MAG TPA: TonB-dependent receptor [Sphingomicrobium sp.]|nr:TonB-dependent receptor [Sphingomicrobium sp.]
MTIRSALLIGAAFTIQSQAEAQTNPEEPQPEVGQQEVQPQQDASEDFADEDEIVVTGARPRGSVIGDIPPENTLNARDVRATGATNISELLSAIAPQIGSAQGRGGERPVMLLNGQRISSFRELRDIPTEAISRVEILPEEVALKYGYRADQRVVNIVLRPRFRSTVALASGNAATEGGYVGATADVTRLMIGENGRTTLNLHAETNGMLTEAERDIALGQPGAGGTPEQQLAARSLVASRRDVRGTATINRTILGDVSATLNTQLQHQEGRSLIGLDPNLLQPLPRTTSTDSANAGVALNGNRSGWRWTLTGNANLERGRSRTERMSGQPGPDRTRETQASGDLKVTANGTLFALPAGNAGTTLTLGASTVHLDTERVRLGQRSSGSLGRTSGEAAINLDLPVSRRGRDFSALGNLTLNANAEVDQLSDFGTLTTLGAGMNWSPAERLNFITSWSREEGAPTVRQLGDPVLDTPGSRVFDFATGQTVLVNAVTGGNPALRSDRRNVWKLGGNWQPFKETDLRLRADFVRQRIADPISRITVTPGIEAAFPDRFVRDSSGRLLSVDLRPVNFDTSRKDTLRLGLDFSKPLKSRQPSQAVLEQMRAQFGFGQRPGGAGSAQPAAGEARSAPAGGAPGGGRRFGGGGPGGGFGGMFGGSNRGRLTFSLTDTITFVDEVSPAPGARVIDYLRGDASGSLGGTPRHQVEAQGGWFNNGLGVRLGANWRSGTNVRTLTGERLRFSPLGTFDLRLFANPGDIPELVVKQPWLRGTQVRLELNNLFDAKPRVRDALGNVPANYQADLLDPLGRTIMISLRKSFLPSPAWFRQQRERGQQRQAR